MQQGKVMIGFTSLKMKKIINYLPVLMACGHMMFLEDGIELLRYNGNEIHIIVPEMVDGKKVVALDSTFDGFYELKV